jgi:hypothetical protein
LNLLVLGMALGAGLRHAGVDKSQRASSQSFGAVLFRELPRQDRRAIWSEMRGSGSRMTLRRETVGDIGAVLRAAPFSIEQAREVLARQDQQQAQWLRAARSALLVRLAEMTDAERAAYADRVEAALSHGPGMRHHDQD